MRVLVCGGRDFDDIGKVFRTMDELHAFYRFSTVIHGAARGADRLGQAWAHARKIEELPFPADWNRYLKRAGPVRNAKMLREGKPELVVAFPGGPGTRDMIARSREAGVEVLEIKL